MQLKQLILNLIQDFKNAGIETPALDARLLVMKAYGLSREELILKGEQDVDISPLFTEFKERRLKGEPVSRILGEREFWSLPFEISPATLDPRPDTEILVESVLKHYKKTDPLRILDLGTGSGCILLALLSELPNAVGVGGDLSEAALKVAQRNAIALGFDNRVQFIHTNWFDQVKGAFDVIVSNPPYIPAQDIADLSIEVRAYDPLSALDGGDDGLSCYRKIISEVDTYLNPSAMIAFEVGQGQALDVKALLLASNFEAPIIYPDLSGIDRVVLAFKK